MGAECDGAEQEGWHTHAGQFRGISSGDRGAGGPMCAVLFHGISGSPYLYSGDGIAAWCGWQGILRPEQICAGEHGTGTAARDEMKARFFVLDATFEMQLLKALDTRRPMSNMRDLP